MTSGKLLWGSATSGCSSSSFFSRLSKLHRRAIGSKKKLPGNPVDRPTNTTRNDESMVRTSIVPIRNARKRRKEKKPGRDLMQGAPFPRPSAKPRHGFACNLSSILQSGTLRASPTTKRRNARARMPWHTSRPRASYHSRPAHPQLPPAAAAAANAAPSSSRLGLPRTNLRRPAQAPALVSPWPEPRNRHPMALVQPPASPSPLQTGRLARRYLGRRGLPIRQYCRIRVGAAWPCCFGARAASYEVQLYPRACLVPAGCRRA